MVEMARQRLNFRECWRVVDELNMGTVDMKVDLTRGVVILPSIGNWPQLNEPKLTRRMDRKANLGTGTLSTTSGSPALDFSSVSESILDSFELDLFFHRGKE